MISRSTRCSFAIDNGKRVRVNTKSSSKLGMMMIGQSETLLSRRGVNSNEKKKMMMMTMRAASGGGNYENDVEESAIGKIQQRLREKKNTALVAPENLRNRWTDDDDDGDEKNYYRENDGQKQPPPRWQNVVKKYVLNPYGVFVIASLFSIANPNYIDKGRSNLAMQLYNRDTDGEVVAYKTKDGGVFKVSKESGMMTYNGKSGLVVDTNGGVWIAVARKDHPEIAKEKYFVGQIEDVPLLPDNPTKGELKLFNEYMQKTFVKTLSDVPKDLKKVYNSPDPESIITLITSP